MNHSSNKKAPNSKDEPVLHNKQLGKDKYFIIIILYQLVRKIHNFFTFLLSNLTRISKVTECERHKM